MNLSNVLLRFCRQENCAFKHYEKRLFNVKNSYEIEQMNKKVGRGRLRLLGWMR